MPESTLTFHEFEDSLWIRCAGRGCFMNSPDLKKIADSYLHRGGCRIVLDLEMCPGVDSTFMGTLAGIAKNCIARGGRLEVTAPTLRTRASMESLGLDMLVDIDPPDASWRAQVAERRATLIRDASPVIPDEEEPDEIERTRHVLQAHNTLRAMNKKNDATFGYVCEVLEEDLERRGEREK